MIPVKFNQKYLYSCLFIFISCVMIIQYFYQLRNEENLEVLEIEKELESERISEKRAISRMVDMVSSFNLVCDFEGRNGKSICKEPDDEKLSEIIAKDYFDRPTGLPYSFKNNPPELKGQIGAPQIVDKLLKGKRNGFFIESGAYDGEDLSNSLFFELERNFTGLLVEPNQLDYPKLLGKHRKATSINACYSMTPLPTLVDFVNSKYVSGIQSLNLGGWIKQHREKIGHTQSQALCFPFYSILLAMGNPTVDYFSLDVEGAELPILKTIPWDKVNITILSIEVNHSDGNKIDTFIKSKGYKKAHHLVYDNIYEKV